MTSQKKLFAYGSIGVGILAIVLALNAGGLGLIGLLIALAGTALGVALIRMGHIIVPIITQRTKINIISANDYEVPPSQDLIVKKANGVYYASVFFGVEIYESPTEKFQEEGIYYNEFFERAVSNLEHVTKIGYILYVEEITKKREEIEAKRAEIQLRMKRERDKGDPDPLRLDRLQRELEMEDAKLFKLIKGIKPMGIVGYAMTTAAGVSRDSAITSAKAQAEQVKTALSNSLNVEVKWLSGDQMLKCFEWERFCPGTFKELEESLSW